MTRRIERINELIKQEVGKIIQKEIHCGRYLITMTGVETSSDLNHASISISVIPEKKENEAIDNLKSNAGYIQKLLNKKMRIKFVPKISFVIDKGAKSANTVDVILEGIRNDKH